MSGPAQTVTLESLVGTTATAVAAPVPDTAEVVATDVRAVVGPVEFSLPPQAGDFRQTDVVPDFVVATQRRAVSDLGIVTVVVQSVVPLFPDDDLIGEFDADALHWKAYDTGKYEGSGTTAYAELGGGFAVLVGGVAWIDSGADELIRGYAVDLAKSLIYRGEG